MSVIELYGQKIYNLIKSCEDWNPNHCKECPIIEDKNKCKIYQEIFGENQ